MPDEHLAQDVISLVRRWVDVFNQTDLIRLRISDEADNAVELRRASPLCVVNAASMPSPNGAVAAQNVIASNVDIIKSDLVGIAHLGKPMPFEGYEIESDRELAYVEALGIRNPVRSRGAGRVTCVLVSEGQAVEYGQPLFEIERP